MAKYAAPDIPETAGTTDAPESFDLSGMARLLEVSRSGYHQWRKRRAATELTPRQQRRADLTVKILDVHAESAATYGSPRITAELREHGGEGHREDRGGCQPAAWISPCSPFVRQGRPVESSSSS
jgi:putative transposase